MIRLLPLAMLLGAPVAAEDRCISGEPIAGFAPGQARMADAPAPGATVSLSLKPVEEVAFAPRPARRPEAGTFGGVFPLEVKAGGTYRITLSDTLWIDVVRDGATLPSTDHQHGAPCSGVAKIVAFRLEPGRYAVQLSEARQRAVTVRVTREALLPAKH